MQKTEIGNKAELQACKFLISQNVKIIEQNFKALPYGEIDIIAIDTSSQNSKDSGSVSGMTVDDENTLVFVEVKYRKSTSFGTAQEMVSHSKQQKIINTANIFLEKNLQYQNYECRFDVIAINNSNIEWIKDAFMLG
ncbi:YraN family protein [Francisellaceae bacterium CB299]|jgi:putative endonuclease